jgi:maleylacetoacetate isomerase/maleylpyruvate isomerase
MELHNYFRSSASWRVRIALALKGLDYDYRPVHLVKQEQSAPGFVAASSTGLVPLLVDGELRLHQSLAIIEYLDETHPEPPLLPRDAPGRARVRALAQDIACEIHPLNNLRVLRYLTQTLGASEEAKGAWIRHWVEDGLAAVERQLAAAPSAFCHGEAPGRLRARAADLQRAALQVRPRPRAERHARARRVHGAGRIREHAAFGLPGRGMTTSLRCARRPHRHAC